jgi:hypothetical protein
VLMAAGPSCWMEHGKACTRALGVGARMEATKTGSGGGGGPRFPPPPLLLLLLLLPWLSVSLPILSFVWCRGCVRASKRGRAAKNAGVMADERFRDDSRGCCTHSYTHPYHCHHNCNRDEENKEKDA